MELDERTFSAHKPIKAIPALAHIGSGRHEVAVEVPGLTEAIHAAEATQPDLGQAVEKTPKPDMNDTVIYRPVLDPHGYYRGYEKIDSFDSSNF